VGWRAALGPVGIDLLALHRHVDVGSPTADLAATPVQRIADETGAMLPACCVGNTLFFGQDRLDFVREALAAA